jgi:hypothetical protein
MHSLRTKFPVKIKSVSVARREFRRLRVKILSKLSVVVTITHTDAKVKVKPSPYRPVPGPEVFRRTRLPEFDIVVI